MRKMGQYFILTFFCLNVLFAALQAPCPDESLRISHQISAPCSVDADQADRCGESERECDLCPACIGQTVAAVEFSTAAIARPTVISNFLSLSQHLADVSLGRVSEPPIA